MKIALTTKNYNAKKKGQHRAIHTNHKLNEIYDVTL